MNPQLLLGFLIVSVNCVFAGSYYVSPTGNDNAAGSFDQPWSSVISSVNKLNPGDSLLIRGGTYKPGGRVVVKNANTQQKYITIAGYPGERAVLDFENRGWPNPSTSQWIMWDAGVFLILESSCVRVKNLRIINADSAAGIMALHASRVHIEQCSTWNTMSSGISAWNTDSVVIRNNIVDLACNTGWNECITLTTCSDFIVSGNEVKNNTTAAGSKNGGEGIDVKGGSAHGIINDNYVHDLYRLGMYVDGWSGTLQGINVCNNRITRCDNGLAIGSEGGTLVDSVSVNHNQIYRNRRNAICVWSWDGGSLGPRSNIFIENNTCYGNEGGIDITATDIHDLYVRNNIVWGNSAAGMTMKSSYDAQSQNLVFAYNLVEPKTGVGAGQIVVPGTSTITAHPLFVDTASNDFHLKSGSPAIDAGDPSARFNDPDGTRNDRGAFPYASSLLVQSFDRMGNRSHPHAFSARLLVTDHQLAGSGGYVVNLTGRQVMQSVSRPPAASGFYVVKLPQLSN